MSRSKVCKDIVQEFEDVFAEGLGTIKELPVTLYVDPSVIPIHLKARNVTFAQLAKIGEEIDHLCKAGVLEPIITTDWAMPVIDVFKPIGELRLCGDFKSTLNRALTDAWSISIPSVAELLADLSEGRYFMKLDLSKAYLQLRVDEPYVKLQTILYCHREKQFQGRGYRGTRGGTRPSKGVAAFSLHLGDYAHPR